MNAIIIDVLGKKYLKNRVTNKLLYYSQPIRDRQYIKIVFYAVGILFFFVNSVFSGRDDATQL